MIQQKTNSEQETTLLGFKIGQLVKKEERVVFLLDGQLGSGKTTFTKGIAKGVGVKAIVNSPTYTIMKKYRSKEDKLFYHLDLYRLDGMGSDFDLEEYIDAPGIIVIEWPFQVKELLPNDFILIEIEKHLDTKRSFNITYQGLLSRKVVEKLEKIIF